MWNETTIRGLRALVDDTSFQVRQVKTFVEAARDALESKDYPQAETEINNALEVLYGLTD